MQGLKPQDHVTWLTQPFTAHTVTSFADFSARNQQPSPSQLGRCFAEATMCKFTKLQARGVYDAAQAIVRYYRGKFLTKHLNFSGASDVLKVSALNT